MALKQQLSIVRLLVFYFYESYSIIIIIFYLQVCVCVPAYVDRLYPAGGLGRVRIRLWNYI